MKIAIVAAEISPWAKVGGLADVIGALPRALAAIGAQPVLIMPGYRGILSKVAAKPVAEGLAVQLGATSERFTLMLADGPGDVALYLIVHPRFFDRDGVYGENGKEYPDNVARYVFFGRAAARAAAEFVKPDVVHAHDWHAASTSIVMRADPAFAQTLDHAVSVFTIHNLAFQGICEHSDFALLGIPPSYFTMENLEFHGRVNLMKGAVVLADGASTVSPAYAREVTADPELGFGLEGVLRNKGARFIGILNGADYDEWNPATDTMIAATYEPGRPEGKRACVSSLYKSVGLAPRAGVPLVGMVSRMTAQKGFDLLREALERVMALDLKLVMLASGDSEMETFFRNAERRYPDRFRVVLEFNNAMAHRIMAGCDAFLMPSQFEPCGLTQMYALKYGTVPVVRATGGLRDTVAEFDPAEGAGNGFVFEAYRAEHLVGALARMARLFRSPEQWQRLRANCFKCDFSWTRSARSYLTWFEELGRQRLAPHT
jgi:starch synthase